MKICKVCLQSDILCNSCSKKLEDGKISRADIELDRAIHKINKEKDFDVEFLCAFEEGSKLYVVVDSKNTPKFIGPGGKNVKKVSELIGKQIKVMEKANGSERHVIERLLGVPVLGINRVYSGSESLKVRIEKRYMRAAQPLANVVNKVLGKRVSFVFE